MIGVKTIFLCIAFGFLFIAQSYGQFERVVIGKRKIEKKSSIANNQLKILALDITRGQQTDRGKALAIFDWVTTHIAYDQELRFSKDLQKRIYSTERNVVNHVLLRNKALCGGYAFLYRELCREVGIKAVAIHGYSKKYGVTPSSKIDHTWNAVLLNGQWRLLDLTQAIAMSTKDISPRKWFDCNPRYFIRTHYPEDTRWSMIKNPPSRYKAFEITK